MPYGTTVLRPSLPPWRFTTTRTRSSPPPGTFGSAGAASARAKRSSRLPTTVKPETAPMRNRPRFMRCPSELLSSCELVGGHGHREVRAAAHALIEILAREHAERRTAVAAQKAFELRNGRRCRVALHDRADEGPRRGVRIVRAGREQPGARVHDIVRCHQRVCEV